MSSLLSLAQKLFGVTDVSKLTDEQLKEISKKMREGQRQRWGEMAQRFGLEGKTPEAQQKIDEQKGQIMGRGGESKG